MGRTEILDKYNKDGYERAALSLDYQLSVLSDFADMVSLPDRSARVLDLASGKGQAADYFERAFDLNVVRADVSLTGLRMGQNARVRSLADQLPFPDDSFDAIHMKDALVHIPDMGKLFEEQARVLRPGGKSIIVSADPPPYSIFPVELRGTRDKQWKLINSEDDYMRQAEGLAQNPNVSNIGVPYYRNNIVDAINAAQGAGLNLVRETRWAPQSEDWYKGSPTPAKRFVLLFEKVGS